MNPAELDSLVAGMPWSWWLALPPALGIAFLACAARLTQGSWLAPGAAWAGFWSAAIWLPLIFAPHYPVSPGALWTIAGFVLVTCAGSQIALQGPRAAAAQAQPVARDRLMKTLCLVGCAAGFLTTGLTLVQYQASWSVWASPARLGELAHTISVARYANEANESVLVRLCLVFSYLGSLAGGHAMGWRPGRFAWWSVSPILGALSYALLTTAKGGLLIAMLVWLAAYATERLRRTGRAWRVSWRIAVLGFAGTGLVVVLFVTAMLLRYGFDHGEDRAFIGERLRNYSVSHVTAFSSWWDSPGRSTEPVSWGRLTLVGPATLLGLADRQQGVYEVIFTDRYQVDSNLFTIYRSLITDCTLPGALLFMALVGYVAGRCYRSLLQGHGSALAAVFLTAYFTVLGWSHIINALGYTTLVLSFCLYVVACGTLGHRPPKATAGAIPLHGKTS